MTIDHTTTSQFPAADGPTDAHDTDDTDYFPMFLAALQVAALTVVVQFGATMLVASWSGVEWELQFWRSFLPYFAMATDLDQFESVIKWANIGTAGMLGGFSVAAFLSGRRLQVQAGRAFAWFDIALLGGVHVIRTNWFSVGHSTEAWMLWLLLVGVVGFAVSWCLIWIDFSDRENDLANVIPLVRRDLDIVKGEVAA